METAPISILVIDGDSASRNYLSVMLTKSGYTVLSASSGREGLISAWRDKPRIIIMDSVLPDLTGLDLVTRLRQDRRTSNVTLIVLSSRENPQEMTDLLNAGSNEYLVKSSQTLQKLLELLPNLAQGEKPSPMKQGRLIVFLSAKGGTGTSSLCVNIASSLAVQKEEKSVAVMDLVLPIGSIANITGYTEHLDLISAAAQGQETLTAQYFKDNLPRIPAWNFNLLAGVPDPESAGQLSGEKVGAILNAIVGAYDYVFVDLGRSLSRITLPIIQKADVIVLILSTDLATADLTLKVLEYLKVQGVDMQRIYAIQNRAIGLEGMTKPALEKMIGLPVSVTMLYLGDNLTVANNRHEPLAARNQSDSIAIIFNQIANQLDEVGKKTKR